MGGDVPHYRGNGLALLYMHEMDPGWCQSYSIPFITSYHHVIMIQLGYMTLPKFDAHTLTSAET